MQVQSQRHQSSEMSGKILALLILSIIGDCLAFDLYLPSLSSMQLYFLTDHETIQWTLSAIALGSGIAPLICGPYADAWGRRRVFLCFQGLYVVGSVMCCLNVSIQMIILARFIQGLGSGAPVVLSFAIAADLCHGRQRTRVFGYLTAALTLSLMFAPVMGGFIEQIWGWYGNFVCILMVSSAAFLAIWWGLPETLPQFGRVSVVSLFYRYGVLFYHRGFMILSLLPALLMGGLMCFLSAASLYYIGHAVMSPFAFGWYQSAFMLVQAIAGWLVGQLAARYSMLFLLRLGLSLSISAGLLGGVVCLLQMDPFWFLMVIFLLYSAGLSMVFVTATDMGLKYFPEAAATASAMGAFTRGIAIGACLSLQGWFYRGGTLQPVLLLVACIVVIVFILILFGKNQFRSVEQESLV